MTTSIEDYRSFSIHDLKRLGMLCNGFGGILSWTQGKKTCSSLRIQVFLSDSKPGIVLYYTFANSGESVLDTVKLHFQESNLPGHTGGYWMFVCPVTGKPCRVLYLHNGHYVSRRALPKGVIYKCQTFTGCFRIIGRIFNTEDTIESLYKSLLKPYRKKHYRGKPTRTAQRLMKAESKYGEVLSAWKVPKRWRR